MNRCQLALGGRGFGGGLRSPLGLRLGLGGASAGLEPVITATAADPEVVETIKRSRQPYFVLDGNICALLAAKDHVNVFLYDGAIVPDPEGIITAGHGNQTARTVAFKEGEPINRRALSAMLKQIVANNRAGGWRKLKPKA